VSHARRQHPNAPLTPEGRQRMVTCVVDRHWTVEATAGAVPGRRQDRSQVARSLPHRRRRRAA
jgi:hypothetical protein